MSDFTSLDFYQLLDVARTATRDEIKRGYRREISKYHPDRFANAPHDQQQYAQARSQQLTEAYATLSDFKARSTYNARLGPTIRGSARQPAKTPQPRDHQAELYDQSLAHIRAGRTLQAIGTLRQLQQINPFYRDSADMLARAEAQAQLQQPARPAKRDPRRAVLFAGGLAGLAIIGAATWALAQRGAPQPQRNQAAIGVAATAVATALPAPTAAPTVAPTAAPTSVPTSVPTSAPEITPTAAPTSAPPAIVLPTAPAEDGEVIFADDFSSDGWADTIGRGWSVGYNRERYRIAVDPGIGTIWSYRSVRLNKYSVGADVQVTKGEGGLLLAFASESSYLSFTVNPTQTSYRLEQRRGDSAEVLSGGQNAVILPGRRDINRLVARVVGTHVQLLINGQLVADVVVQPPPSTRFGFLTIASSTAAESFFDNLEVRELK